jgi:hypothetical protein
MPCYTARESIVKDPAPFQTMRSPTRTAPGLDLTRVRDDVLAYCDSLRDRDGPYGAYRMAPGKRPDLYASCSVALMRSIMGEDLRQTLTPDDRDEWADHINSFQSRVDGHYEDRMEAAQLHANGMTIGALGAIGQKQRYRVRLYEPFSTLETVTPWLEESVDWRNQWDGSHLFWGGIHCFSMSRTCEPAWRKRVFDWLDANLDEQTGWWRKGVPHADRHDPLGGGVHILPFYEHHSRSFPLPDRVIDSVLALQLPSGRWFDPGSRKTAAAATDLGVETEVDFYLELDALYALQYMHALAPDYREDDVRQAVTAFAALLTDMWPTLSREFSLLHPHLVLAVIGALGLLQRLLPKHFRDDADWSDIFSDRRFYLTDLVEA